MAEVVWHERAYSQRKRLLSYTAETFGTTIAEKLNKQIETRVEHLKLNPKIGFPEPVFKDTVAYEIRSILVSKRFKIVYTITVEGCEETVMILSLWDSKRNPETLRTDLAKD